MSIITSAPLSFVAAFVAATKSFGLIIDGDIGAEVAAGVAFLR
jgi:hypothetical protein